MDILQMQVLNEAYEVVGSLEKRAQYDLDRLNSASPAPWQRDPPPAQPTQTAPGQKDQDRPAQAPKDPPRREPDARLYGWLRSQIKIIIRLMFLTLALFVWSLVTGQVNIAAVLVLVLVSVFVIASMVTKIRGPMARSRRRPGKTW